MHLVMINMHSIMDQKLYYRGASKTLSSFFCMMLRILLVDATFRKGMAMWLTGQLLWQSDIDSTVEP